MDTLTQHGEPDHAPGDPFAPLPAAPPTAGKTPKREPVPIVPS